MRKKRTMNGDDEINKQQEIEKIRDDLDATEKPDNLETPPEKKRRKRRAKKIEQEPVTISKEAWASLVAGLAEYTARVRGDAKWLMTVDEAKNIGDAADRVSAKYFPLLASYQEELALGLLLIMYWLPRAQTITLRPESEVSNTDENHKA